MNKSLLKVVIFVFCISFIMAWLRPNAMEEIGRLQAYVLNGVPESEGYHPAWEWEMSLDTVGTLSVDYKTEYLRKDVPFIALYFSNDSKDIGIGVTINLSEQDKVGLEIGANYYGSLTLNHLKISRKARNGFIFCQILIFILHVTYKYCIMYLRWHK